MPIEHNFYIDKSLSLRHIGGTMANRLKSILANRAISGAELARQVGVSAAAICRYGQGTRTPPLDVAYRIAFALNCDVRDVFPPVFGDTVKQAG